MIDLINTEEKNKGDEVINHVADDYIINPVDGDDYLVDPIEGPTNSMDDYLMDSIDEEEIMLNKEWVQALIDLDEAGYDK